MFLNNASSRLLLFFVVCLCFGFFIGCELESPASPTARPIIYVFTAPGCYGCDQDKPRVDQLERAGYTVVRFNIMIHLESRRRYHVDAVPLYLVIYHNKVVLRTHDLNLVYQKLSRVRKAP